LVWDLGLQFVLGLCFWLGGSVPFSFRVSVRVGVSVRVHVGV